MGWGWGAPRKKPHDPEPDSEGDVGVDSPPLLLHAGVHSVIQVTLPRRITLPATSSYVRNSADLFRGGPLISINGCWVV